MPFLGFAQADWDEQECPCSNKGHVPEMGYFESEDFTHFNSEDV